MNSGSDETWVAFVQARFAPPLIQNGTSQQRAEMYGMLVRDLSTIAIERVMREGRDAPLQLHVKGSRGNGVVILGIDESSPLRIVSFGVEADLGIAGGARARTRSSKLGANGWWSCCPTSTNPPPNASGRRSPTLSRARVGLLPRHDR